MIDKNVVDAAQNLNSMRERWEWEDTTVWHHPDFLDGKINVSTKELRDVKILLDWFEANTNVQLDRWEKE
jgi:hypothetical protein